MEEFPTDSKESTLFKSCELYPDKNPHQSIVLREDEV
jgi:hypothetical protein